MGSNATQGTCETSQVLLAGVSGVFFFFFFFFFFVTLAELSHSKSRRWKSMLIHQGWFTALHTQHLLDSPSLEFEICIFSREAIPSHYSPLLEDGLGTTWVRQLRAGSCHHPTAATKCNDSRAKPQQTPSVESKLIHQGWFNYCAIYPTLTRFT